MNNIRSLEEQYRSQIKRILNRNIHHVSSLKESTYEQDTKEAFDAIYSFNDAKIPIRIREPKYISYRDFTIRCRSLNGGRTEYDKLVDGFGDYYFYAWENESRKSFHSYIIVDIHKFRSSGIICHPDDHRKNGDGTQFYAYCIKTLIAHDCLKIYEAL
jgi:hypothetical protein